MMSQLSQELVEQENKGNLQSQNDRPSLLVYDDTSESDLCDMIETKVISALFNLLNTNENQNATDDAICTVIDLLKSKYSLAEGSEPLTFDDFLELAEFTFNDETTENLIAAIEHFEPMSHKFGTDFNEHKKRIILKCRCFAFEVNKDFFYSKLRQTIDSDFQHPDNFKHIDSNYVRLLNICTKSKLAFQHFYRRAATIMMQHRYPDTMQDYLDQFVFDIRVRQPSLEEFYKMYAEDLYFYVKIINELDSSDSESQTAESVKDNPLVYNLLLNLQSKDLIRFVVLSSHFKRLQYLLKKNCD